MAQPVMAYQYRYVSPENAEEFVKRETTYWQKVAQKAIDDGKMGFWGLFEKVSVYDQPNTSNYLFINTFDNIDMAGDAMDVEAVFPKVKMSEMETNSMSTVTSQIFVAPENWVDGANSVPAEDYNYIVMNYFDPADVSDWLTMENEHFMPFVEGEMKKDVTSQKAWGNARVLAPLGGGMNATTISLDLYKTLHEALRPKWDEGAQFPEDAIMKEWERFKSPHQKVIYRIVAVASSDD